jgi:hypothetical protein
MRMSQVISESYLYEGLDRDSARTMQLWENAGRKLVEANLDAATIQKIFAQAEQGAAAGGDNRTLLGLGKDAATAVKAAYDDLAKKIQDSGPVKNIDAKYDQAAEKLKAATGGDQGVMKYVQKYRDFAKAHPIAQSLIYSALIAAAGISGAGLGGAAALGLLKMTDKLLQGEKFSTAVGKGAETGAMAYAAGQIGKAMRGGDQAQTTTTTQNYSQQTTGLQSDLPSTASGFPQSVLKQYPTANFDYKSDGEGYWAIFDKAGKKLRTVDLSNMDLNTTGAMESINLTNSQLAEMFAAVTVTMVNEGLWDAVKSKVGQAVGAVVNKAQQVGSNLTNKVTADKLNKAWVAAGSPTDSEQVKQVLITAGVPENVVADVYKQMKISSGGEQPKLTVKQINELILKLRLRDLQSLQKSVNAALQKRTKTS